MSDEHSGGQALADATDEITDVLARQVGLYGGLDRKLLKMYHCEETNRIVMSYEYDELTDDDEKGVFVVIGAHHNPNGLTHFDNQEYIAQGNAVLDQYQLGWRIGDLKLLVDAGLLSEAAFIAWTANAVYRFNAVKNTEQDLSTWRHTFNVE